jgi:hypothetical protein
MIQKVEQVNDEVELKQEWFLFLVCGSCRSLSHFGCVEGRLS